MDMFKVIKAIRFANKVNNLRQEKNKALAMLSDVTYHVETTHETREVCERIVNKEVGREDLRYVVKMGKRYGPGVANRVYARYMRQRALEMQELEEDSPDEQEEA